MSYKKYLNECYKESLKIKPNLKTEQKKNIGHRRMKTFFFFKKE